MTYGLRYETKIKILALATLGRTSRDRCGLPLGLAERTGSTGEARLYADLLIASRDLLTVRKIS
jgi:hypothetical protein